MAGIALALCWLLCGCGKSADRLAIARVGDREITIEQLRDFERRLPEELQTRETGAAGHLDYLRSLLDKEILIQEARKRGLGDDPELRRKLGREREEQMLRAFLDSEFSDELELSDEELRGYLAQTGRDREVAVRKIVVKTREEAEEIMKLLGEGGDFAELAKRRSIHKPTAPQGGQIRGYARKDDMIPLFQQKVFPLRKGERAGPVELPDGNYAIFQVTDERPLELRAVRGELEGVLREKKYAAGMEALVERLQKDLELRTRYEGLRFLAERAGRGESDFSPAERDTLLYEFAGGRVALGDVVDLARDLQMSLGNGEQGQALWFATQIAMPRALLLEAARRAAIDEEEIAAWLQRREQALLLLAIRRAVVGGVAADGEEARQYYDRHPEVFASLDSTRGQAPEPFARVEKRARALVRLEKQDRLFEEFLRDLRRQYDPMVEIYTDNLKILSQQEDGDR